MQATGSQPAKFCPPAHKQFVGGDHYRLEQYHRLRAMGFPVYDAGVLCNFTPSPGLLVKAVVWAYHAERHRLGSGGIRNLVEFAQRESNSSSKWVLDHLMIQYRLDIRGWDSSNQSFESLSHFMLIAAKAMELGLPSLDVARTAEKGLDILAPVSSGSR